MLAKHANAHRHAALMAALGCSIITISPTPAAQSPAQKLIHHYMSVAISPDGNRVVAIENDDAQIQGEPERKTLVIRPTDGSASRTVALPCDPDPECVPSDPAWSPDSRRVVFVLRSPNAKTRALYSVGADGSDVRKLLEFAGVLNDPLFSSNGQLAVLATSEAHKEIGAIEAGAAIVGEIGTAPDEQRIAIVDGAKLQWASPSDLFVYEYDWKPDGSGFAGTAAHGDGDNNWWVAKLYTFDAKTARARIIYSPASPQQQISHPRVSSDGTTVAFIGGLMSDFVAVGGDVYVVPAGGGVATDVTPHLNGSATTLGWLCASDEKPQNLWLQTIDGADENVNVTTSPAPVVMSNSWFAFGETWVSDFSTTCTSKATRVAFVRQSFEEPPEIFIGLSSETAQPITQANAGVQPVTHAQSITWTNDGFTIQGWLLAPLDRDHNMKHPMVMDVHGGPAAANVPRFVGRGTDRDLLNEGYYLFLPNPRGSFGQGEPFARANVKDFGYGDLRDDLTGIDAVEKQTGEIDDAKLGITGGSYGGYMTMWAVTQTNRFKAGVAGAGLSDWISYYGENGIDEWMIPFFGASAYDDPAVYRKSSPIEFIKNVKTPTFAYVGERDVECPASQSLEFWHALHTLGVPTQLIIYPGEGHRLRNPAHIADAEHQTVEWFDKYLK